MERRLIHVALGWGIIVALGLAINGRFYTDVLGNAWRLLEAAIVLVLLLGLAAYRPIWAALQGLGAIRGAALLGAVGLVGVGQMADRARMTYPFVPWPMYSQADVIPDYTEYLATLESGRVIDFPFHLLIPTHEPRSLSYNFTGRLQRASGSRPDSAAQHRLQGLMVSLAETYNERYPRDPIRHVDIRTRSIPLHDFDGPESLSSRHLLRYTVSEAPR